MKPHQSRLKYQTEDSFPFPRRLGKLEGCYIFTAPAAALGLLLGGWVGFISALAGNTCFWILLAFLDKRRIRKE